MLKILNYILHLFGLPLWHMQKFFLRDNRIWIFGAWFGQKYSDNSKYLFEYICDHHPEINAIWITKNQKVFEKLKTSNKRVYLTNTIQAWYYTIRAGYCFLTSGTEDVNSFLLNGCKQVWLWHGMPLKKICFEDDSYKSISVFKKMIIKYCFPYLDMRPDYTVSSASFFNGFLSLSFKLSSNHILNFGLPRCDVFFSEKKDSMINTLRENYSKCRIFLYMPTFRMAQIGQGNQFNPFSEKYGFNEKEFSKFLEENNLIFLYKPHYVDAEIKIDLKNERFMLISDNDYEDLYVVLNSIDALVTDYSSVYFDFLSSNKPVFLLPFDYSDYIKKSRSHFFNMYEHMKAPYFTNWIDFFEFVTKSTWDNPNGFEKNKFCEYIDGQSCKKITDFLLNV